MKNKIDPSLETKIRNIPRNQYGHCLPDPLMRYMYKYNFDRYCQGFLIVDRETGDTKTFECILDLMIYLCKPNGLWTGGVPEEGIPIAKEGFTCHYKFKELEDGEIELNPYFVCRIVVDNLGSSSEIKAGSIQTYFFKP